MKKHSSLGVKTFGLLIARLLVLISMLSVLPQTVLAADNVAAGSEKEIGDQFGLMDDAETFQETAEPQEEDESKKVVSILGDSIGTYQGYTEPWTVYYYYYCSEYMDVSETWWMRYIENNHMRLGINESLGASKVAYVEDDGTGYDETRSMASIERIQRLGENGEPDTILFFGGTNDVGHTPLGTFTPGENIGVITDFASAYQTAIVRMKELYPNAEIICITPYYRDISEWSDIGNDQVDSYADCIAAICQYYEVECVDLRTSGLHPTDDMCTRDYLHVNENGHYKIWNLLDNGVTEPNPDQPSPLPVIQGLTWTVNETDIQVGMNVTGTNSGTRYRWQVYDVEEEVWYTISPWSKEQGASWQPEKGVYWLNATVRAADGTRVSQTIAFQVDRNYPVYINGKYQGPNPYGQGWLIGVSTNVNPNQKYRYELLILDCEKYTNGDANPWIYGTGLKQVKSGTTFWTTWSPPHKGYYWTYFRIWDENDKLIEDQCYGAAF